ncbi:hypothetical protein Noda2021_12190 [Candidatus Dependentiae bacterium Noda2021]|nr:hypothetical protein Noda2021_12190 [Candidatus Dependentiae bacterium Noda2021]
MRNSLFYIFLFLINCVSTSQAMHTEENYSFGNQQMFIKNEIKMDEDCIYLEAQLQKHKKELTQLELKYTGKIGDLKAIQEQVSALTKKDIDINVYENSLYQRKRYLMKQYKRVNPDTVV